VRIVLVLLLGAFLALGLGRCSPSETLGTGGSKPVPNWAEQQGFEGNERAVAGARVFAQVGCLTCHTYLGTGNSNLGAPDLSAIGRDTHRTEAGFAEYVANPSAFGNEVMPPFNALPREKLLLLGAFLRASKGRR
jgi:mono/diheme cytochrome c family protein